MICLDRCWAKLCEFCRYERAQEGSCHQDTLKTIYNQLATKQEEINSLREKLESMKTITTELQYMNSALQVKYEV